MQERLELLLRSTNVQNIQTELANGDRNGVVADSKDNTTPDNRGPDHKHTHSSANDEAVLPHSCSTDDEVFETNQGMSLSTVDRHMKNGADQMNASRPRGISLDRTAEDDGINNAAASGLLEVDTQPTLYRAESNSKKTALDTPL